MRFTIEITRRASDDVWDIETTARAADPGNFSSTTLSARCVRRRGGDAAAWGAFPALADPAEAPPNDLCGLHGDLTNRSLFDAYASLANGQPKDRQTEAFGRYLFATLLGNHLWAEITAAAGAGESIELALRWSAEEWELTRLPWELMHDGTHFLVADDQRLVGISRLVCASQPVAAAGDGIAPRVLFVVGSKATDPQIRPGAEYLGLLRRLETQGLSFQSRILVAASPTSLKAEIRQFRPSVVHFICHGGVSDDRSYITLMPDESDPKSSKVFPDTLLPLLTVREDAATGTPAHQPAVVVLNACETGNLPATQVFAPFAAHLVDQGVPIVVGMAGRVADRACRLFTRRFYEALLRGESIIEAAAEGRWAAFAEAGLDPCSHIDWSFPALFMADDACPQLALHGLDQIRAIEEIAREIAVLNNPRSFCNRWEIVEEDYRSLIDAQDGGASRVLAIEVQMPDQKDEEPRYGKTRLLQEFAAKSIREGHLPCLIECKERGFSALMDVCVAIVVAIDTTRDLFDALEFEAKPLVDYEVVKVKQLAEDPSREIVLHPDVLEMIAVQTGPMAGRYLAGPVVTAALRVDLDDLVNEARQKLPTGNAVRVLLLFDDLQSVGETTQDVIGRLLDAKRGIVRGEDAVRIVFTYSSKVTLLAYATALDVIDKFIDQRSSYIRHSPLEPFADPGKDTMPYHDFLLGQEPPLMVDWRVTPQNQIDLFFSDLHLQSGAAPTGLKNEKVAHAVKLAKGYEVLKIADDEQVLRVIDERRRGVTWRTP